MGDCFVCLQETTEKSPCECGAPVHAKCLMLAAIKADTTVCSICKEPLKNVTKKRVTVLNRQAVAITGFFALCSLSLFSIAIALFVHASFIGGSSVSSLHLAASVFLVVSFLAGLCVFFLVRKTVFWHEAVRVRVEWV